MTNKNVSFYDPGLVVKDVHEKDAHAIRTFESKSVVTGAFSHFDITYNVDNNPEKIVYYIGRSQQLTEVITLPATSLNNKYFTIRFNPSNKLLVIWYNLDNTGTQPVIPDAEFLEVNIATGDSSSIVALATKLALGTLSQYFQTDLTRNNLSIRTVQTGLVDDSTAGTSGFTVVTTAGTEEIVTIVDLDYNGQNPIWEGQELIDYKLNPYTGLFEQNTTYQNDLITDELIKANESLDAIEADTDLIRIAVQSIDLDFDVPLSTRATETTQLQNKQELISINLELDNISLILETFDRGYGLVTNETLRTAAQIGNATGAADFNEGATSAQTLRTSSNQGLPNTIANAWTVKLTDGTDNVIFTPVKDELHFNGSQFGSPSFGLDRSNPRKWRPIQVDTNGSISAHAVRADGGEVSYGAGSTDSGTQRVTANITRNGTELSYNDGPSDANTIRVSSNDHKHDGTNKDYNAGITGVQTPRVTANITRNGTELSYNNGTSDANTQRVSANIKLEGNAPDTNYGAVSANTIRVASQVGNATGAADFNAGVTGAQTPRVTANITRNGTELSYNDGTSDANTQRVSANLTRNGTQLSYNIGAADANTIRVASQLHNGTASADYNAGITGANTLRTAANVYGFDGNNLRQIKTDTTGSIETYSNLRSITDVTKTLVANTVTLCAVGASNLSGRKYLKIVNNGTVAAYVSSRNNVTTTGASKGETLFPNQEIVLEVTDAQSIYIISALAIEIFIQEGL